MVIHENIPGIEVSVHVDGKVVKEYPAENDEFKHEDPTVVLYNGACTRTTYIEATTGKSFIIKMKAHLPFTLSSPTIGFDVYVDGRYIDGTLMSAYDYLLANGQWEETIQGPPTRKGPNYFVKPMKFTELKSTSSKVDKLTIRKQLSLVDKVGSIVVEVHRRTALAQANQAGFTPVKLNDISAKFHEKALVKGNQSHGVVLGGAGEPAVEEYVHVYDTELLSPDYPIAVFVFKYRSEKALKQLHAIPQTPSPEPEICPPTLAPAISSEGLSGQIKAQVEKLVQDLLQGQAQTKSKSDVMEKKVKREIPEVIDRNREIKKARMSKFKITIDLTEDDDEDDHEVIVLD